MPRLSEALLALALAAVFVYALFEATRVTDEHVRLLREIESGGRGLYVPTERGWAYVRARDFWRLKN